MQPHKRRRSHATTAPDIAATTATLPGLAVPSSLVTPQTGHAQSPTALAAAAILVLLSRSD